MGYCLAPGGLFLALTIDGRAVLEYFTNLANYVETNGVRKANMSMIDLELRSNNQVFINIPNSIVENQTEYLTNIPELQSLLRKSMLGNKTLNVNVVEEWITNKEKFLTSEELQFSRMFTAFVLKRS